MLPFGRFGVSVMKCIQSLASAVRVWGSHPGLVGSSWDQTSELLSFVSSSFLTVARKEQNGLMGSLFALKT